VSLSWFYAPALILNAVGDPLYVNNAP